MDVHADVGLALGILAGVLLGSFALPMKRIRQWNWENIWTMFSTWALIVLPWLLASYTIPHLFDVLGGVSPMTIFWVLLFGAGWGVANVGFGIGLRLLGMALGMAIILGLNNALGAILPILLFRPNDLRQPAGMAIAFAVFVMLIGIGICALAGAKKDKAQKKIAVDNHADQPHFAKGLAVCLMSGVLGAMFNFALIAGKPIEEKAVELGAMASNAPNATWCVALFGGFLTTMAYCLYLKSKNRSWKLYTAKKSGVNWLLTFLMGLMWFGGVVLFGMAVTKLGRFGPSIGWPVIQSMAVISGNVCGLVTGEWKDAGRMPLVLMAIGLLVLIFGVVVIGWSSTL